MSEKQQWGVGNAAKEKAFDTVRVGHNEDKGSFELIHGEHPHSRRDNTTYARTKDGSIYGFDGHRLPFKIEIEEYNYLKTSSLSGDEIRKGGSAKLFVDGIQVLDEFCRSYEMGYHRIQNFIMEMEEHWGWFPKKVDKEIGRTIGYHEQLFKIKSFVISQGCMILETVDGKPRKPFLWEDDDEYEPDTTLKESIVSENITWYPRTTKQPA